MYVNHNFLIHLSADGHLGCFHVLPKVYNMMISYILCHYYYNQMSSNISNVVKYFLWWEHLRFSRFQVHNTLLLIIVPMVYITSSELIHLTVEIMYHFKSLPIFFTLNHWQPPLYYSWALRVWEFYQYIPLISDIIQYLSFCAWLISLSRLSSRFIHVADGKMSFFFMVEEYNILSPYATFSLFIHPSMDI